MNFKTENRARRMTRLKDGDGQSNTGGYFALRVVNLLEDNFWLMQVTAAAACGGASGGGHARRRLFALLARRCW
jgi:hypothetical protein